MEQDLKKKQKKQRQKMLEILFTALLSAGIAFAQSLLNNYLGVHKIEADPTIAGGIGLSIQSLRNWKYFV